MKLQIQIIVLIASVGIVSSCGKTADTKNSNQATGQNKQPTEVSPQQQNPQEKFKERMKLMRRSVDQNNKEGLEALKRKDYNRAEKLFLVALAQVDNYPKQSGRKAMILVNLAGVYEEKEMYFQAVPLLTKAQKLFIRAFGRKHETVSITLCKLGNVLSKQKRYEEASYVYKTAVGLMEESGHDTGEQYRNALDKLLVALKVNGQGLQVRKVESKIEKLKSM